MAFGSQTNLARGGSAARPESAARRSFDVTRRPPEGGASAAAQACVARVQDYIARRVREEGDAQPRGMARQMAMAVLLLERRDPAGLEQNLRRVVRVYQAAGVTTPAALKKHASEARAILRYGVDEATAARATTGDDALVEIDKTILAIRPREVLERRAHDLSGQRGGRPSTDLFKVLSAVAKLKEVAGSGDPRAEAELKLVRTFLMDD
jgi:hypothetical protein